MPKLNLRAELAVIFSRYEHFAIDT
jgi:hypothetical protein